VLFEILSPLLVHLFVTGPAEQHERPDDEQAADNGRGCKWRVQRRREKLIDNGDDEDGKECGDGREYGRCERDENQKGAREC
jgi:hypothetical protein